MDTETTLLPSDGSGLSVSEENGLDFGIVERSEAGSFPHPTAALSIARTGPWPQISFIEARFQDHDSAPGFLAVLEGQSRKIKPGRHRTIRVTFAPPYEGRFDTVAEFIFYDHGRNGAFAVSRSLSGIAGTLQDYTTLEPQLPYVRPSARNVYEPPRLFVPLLPKNKKGWKGELPKFALPAELADVVAGSAERKEYAAAAAAFLASQLPRELTMETYARYFKALLNNEDAEQQRQLIEMPPWDVTIDEAHSRYTITMSELEEDNLPELNVGDYAFLDNEQEDKRWEARILKINSYARGRHLEMKLVLQMPPKFRLHRRDIFKLRLQLNRMTLRREYQAIETQLQNSRRFLFPARADILPFPGLPRPTMANLQLFNENIRHDDEQLQAVFSVLHHPPGSVPFIVYGPPGTGKTATVVESILQVLTNNPKSCILACAPSNSACDVLTGRLAEATALEGKMLRLHAYSRDVKDCPREVKPYTCTDKEGRFAIPPASELLQYRIVLCTCSSAGHLQRSGIPRGHFTHIFVDEAAQAEEPLAMIPIKALVNDTTNIVLAGDRNQLGPVIHSFAAMAGGRLGRSYLERLMSIQETYDIGTQGGRTIVQLLRNRRSHGAIFAWSNKYMYEDTLRAHADAGLVNSMLGSSFLPKKTFPIMFHGIRGSERRGGKSPSYFNIEEASLVRKYCMALLADKERPIRPEDIGVIAPYKAQVRRIRDLLKFSKIEGILVGSVEQFQGQERRVIIFSTTRSSPEKTGGKVRGIRPIGFVNNRKRVNVAFTRAQAMLIVIGDSEALATADIWRSFINFVHTRGGCTGRKPLWRTQDEVPMLGYQKVILDNPDNARGEEFVDTAPRTSILRYVGN